MTEAVFPAGIPGRGAAALPSRTVLTAAATVGAVAAGVALFEAALLPGLAIGGAAVLATRVLPGARRRLGLPFGSFFTRQKTPAPPGRALALAAPRDAPFPVTSEAPLASRFAIRRSVAKTITYRIIVTGIDFTANYVILGEAAISAGLSAISLAAGPFFYFVHETAWNAYGPAVARGPGKRGAGVVLPFAHHRPAGDGEDDIVVNRSLAKTITFRTFASTMDFATNYLVVRDVPTALLLSATGFLIGPFVYLGHEMAWDRYAPAANAGDEAARA